MSGVLEFVAVLAAILIAVGIVSAFGFGAYKRHREARRIREHFRSKLRP